MSAGKVFICYRREDTAGYSGRVYDRLNARFPGRVFMDVKGIGIGTEWAKVIEQVLKSCQVFVPLIGRHWLAAEEDGTRRLERADDPLRAEIATALRLRMQIIPILMAGGTMPRKQDLPAEIAGLTDWQALRVDDDDFDHDVGKLIAVLERELGEQPLERMDGQGEADRKQAEVARLMHEAEAAEARQDWVGAVQTLQSVLSLDRDHAEAASRLRAARERQSWSQIYEEGQRLYRNGNLDGALRAFRQVRVMGGNYRDVEAVIRMIEAEASARAAPAAVVRPRKSGRKWIAAGIVGFGALMVIGYVAQEMESAGSGGPLGTMPVQTAGPNPAQPSPAAVSQPVAQEPGFAGDYVLASYAINGIPQAIAGSMRLQEGGPGAYQFSSLAGAVGQGVVFQYQGTLRKNGENWLVQIVATNDPNMARFPVRNRITFDGANLVFQSEYRHTVVWRKQQ